MLVQARLIMMMVMTMIRMMIMKTRTTGMMIIAG